MLNTPGNPYIDERWADARVRFELIDVDAAEDATATASSEAEISVLPETHNRIYSMGAKRRSLEWNYLVLDGTFDDPGVPGEVGWWSEGISDSLGNTIEWLQFDFTQDQSSVGFTVIFDDRAGEWASGLIIRAYDSLDNLMAEDIITDNRRAICVSDTPVDGYRRVEIGFTKTGCPSRRVRVCEVVFGIIQDWGPGSIGRKGGIQVLQEVSPTMESLPSGQLIVTIENLERKYNLINPTGIYKFLQEGQGLDVSMGVGERGDIALSDMGRYYYTRAEADDAAMTAKITGNDRLYALDRRMYRTGTIGTDTVENIISEILETAGSDVPVEMDPGIAGLTVGKSIPVVSCREALRLVVQAARAICYIDRADRLVVTRLEPGEVVDVLDNDNLATPAKVKVDEYITAAEAVSFSPVYGHEDKIVIFEAAFSVNGTREVWISYPASAGHSATAAGGSITAAEYYLYSARLTLAGTGEVTVEIEAHTVELAETIYRAGTGPARQYRNVLVRSDFAQDFAAHMLAMQGIEYELVERGNPAREVLDTVRIFDAYGENRTAVVTRQELSFDGTLSGRTEAWGGGI